MNRCLGCMKEKDEYLSVCPHCGYVDGSEPAEIYHLTPGIFLNNKYVVGRALGYDGNTVTYIGIDYVTDKKVLIKEFLPLKFSTRLSGEKIIKVYSGASADKFTAGVNNFAQRAMKLINLNSFNRSQDGIAPFDIFMENNTCYVVEEYSEGEILENIIMQSGAMPFDSAVAVMSGVIKLISELHAENLYHGNLTADNIVITNDNKIKIMNFSYTEGNTAADVFGIASMLYQAVTGTDVAAVSDFANLTSPMRLGIKISSSANSAIMLALKSRGKVSLSEFTKKINEKNDVVNDIVSEEKQEEVQDTKPKNKESKRKLLIISVVIAILLIAGAIFGFVISNNKTTDFESAITVEYSVDNGENFKPLNFTADESYTNNISGDGEKVIFRISKTHEKIKITLKCDDAEVKGILGSYTKEKDGKVGDYMEYIVDVADKDLCKITIDFVLNSDKTTYTVTYKKPVLTNLDSLVVKVDDTELILYDSMQTEYSGIEVEAGKQVAVQYSAPDTHTVKVTCNDNEITENPLFIAINEEEYTVNITVTADGYKENTYTVKFKGIKPTENKSQKQTKKTQKNQSTGNSSYSDTSTGNTSSVDSSNTSKNGKVVVPNYVGMKRYDIGQNNDLKIVIRQDNSDKSLGEDKIWAQYPKPGTSVKKGSTVYLYVYYE